MAETLVNRAQISYTSNGEASTAISNQTNTTLLDRYTMTVEKEALTPTVRAGSNAVYIVRVDNTGAGTLYNLTLDDDLGASCCADEDPLTYVEDSAVFYVNGTETAGTAVVESGRVVFRLAAPLLPGDNLIIVYAAATGALRTRPITNTVTATANSCSESGTPISACDSATVTPVAYANISLFKAADKTSVIAGDTLKYTFTLLNTGAEAAHRIVFKDTLPREFAVTAVSYTVDGETETLAARDYHIDASTNTLTIPAAGSEFAIRVPKATTAGPGIAVITVAGTIA